MPQAPPQELTSESRSVSGIVILGDSAQLKEDLRPGYSVSILFRLQMLRICTLAYLEFV